MRYIQDLVISYLLNSPLNSTTGMKGEKIFKDKEKCNLKHPLFTSIKNLPHLSMKSLCLLAEQSCFSS